MSVEIVDQPKEIHGDKIIFHLDIELSQTEKKKVNENKIVYRSEGAKYIQAADLRVLNETCYKLPESSLLIPHQFH